MKIIALMTTVVLAMGTLFAQEYTIRYDLTMESSEPEIQSQLGMMQGSTLTIYAKDKSSRVESDMGGMMMTTNIIDGKKGKGLMLMDGLIGKIAAKLDYNALQKENDEAAEAMESQEIEFFDETKTIAGYTCKKAVVYGANDLETVYWYTEDIRTDKDAMGKHVNGKLPGVALEYTIVQPQISLHYLASEVKTSLDGDAKSLFSLKTPKGYTEQTLDEVQNLLKMMGGGM